MSIEHRIPRRDFLRNTAALSLLPLAAACDRVVVPTPSSSSPLRATETPPPPTRSLPTPTATERPYTPTPFYEPTPTPAERYLRDLVSSQELKNRYHTSIIDYYANASDFVTLSLREPALRTEPFHSLPDSTDHLTICLIGGPTLHPRYLTPAQKQADPTLESRLTASKNALVVAGKDSISQRKQKEIATYSQKANDLEYQLRNGLISEDRYHAELLGLQYTYERYFPNPSEEDIILEYTGVYSPDYNAQKGLDKYIFLVVKEFPDKTFTYGTESVVVPGKRPTYSRGVDPSQSFISVTKLSINEANKSYVIVGGETPGITLRHELKHAIQGIPRPNSATEHEADMGVIADLQVARKKLDTTGDISGYPFVFRTVGNKYIVTDAPFNSASN